MEWKRNGVAIKEPLIDYLEKLFEDEMAKGHKLSVSIGTDSQKTHGRGSYKFATVILIRVTEKMGDAIKGHGGKVIYRTHYNTFKATNKELVNERMVYEVGKSVEVAYEVASLLDLYDIPLDIHADINPNPKYESNKALQQAVGYILGMGYGFKIKPDAWASSFAADRYC